MWRITGPGGICGLGVIVVIGVGCVLPPPLQEEGLGDAALNAPPVILATDANFPSPGPISLEEMDPRSMALTVRDNDIDDIIFVYLYVDYGIDNVETPALATCSSPGGVLDREVVCSLTQLCNLVSDSNLHILEAMVTDRRKLDIPEPGQPVFRALPTGAGRSFQSWLMTCSTPL